MRKVSALFRQTMFIGLVLAVSFGLFLAATPIISQTSTQTTQSSPHEVSIKVRNYTHSFTVVNLHKGSRNRIRLTLRNDYKHRITAFMIAYGTSTLTIDLAENGNFIAPGASYIQEGTLPPQGGSASEEVVVSVVVFDDKSSDGDGKVAKQILDRRLGQKLQLLRILPLFQNLLSTSDDNLVSFLSTTKAAIVDLPNPTAEQNSFHFRAGYHHAKEEALADLERLGRKRHIQGDQVFRLRLAEITDKYSKRITRF